jgi:hypothetical protein
MSFQFSSQSDEPQHTDVTLVFRLKVEHEGWTQDDLAAWACIRLDRLNSGYRFIKMLNEKGLPSDGILLVKIEKTLRGSDDLKRRNESEILRHHGILED